MRVRSPLCLPGLLFAAVLVLDGCVAPPAAGPQTAAAAEGENFNDPLEPTNRAIFRFNQGVDEVVLVPAAKAYRTVVPPPARQSLHDFMQNLNGPVIFMNDVLQAEPTLAAQTFGRVALNTTAGVGGMFDVATRVGIPFHSNDMGVTLARWGFAEGPYLVLPVLGPSNVRDLTGQIADSFADPADYFAGAHRVYYASVARAAASGIDTRSRNIENLADIEKTSLDYYATIRSLYRQRREAQIRHEQSNLPNPTAMQGSDSGPDPAITYSVNPNMQPSEAPRR